MFQMTRIDLRLKNSLGESAGWSWRGFSSARGHGYQNHVKHGTKELNQGWSSTKIEEVWARAVWKHDRKWMKMMVNHDGWVRFISWFWMILLWGGFRWVQQCQGPGVSKHSKTIQNHVKHGTKELNQGWSSTKIEEVWTRPVWKHDGKWWKPWWVAKILWTSHVSHSFPLLPA
jgi:hypothetical protein